MEIRIRIPNIESLKLIEIYSKHKVISKTRVGYATTIRYVNKLIPHKAGIYFLYNEEKELMYIGQTKDLVNRLSAHHSLNNKWGWVDDWSKVHHSKMLIPKYVKFFVFDKSNRVRIAVEQLLIDKLKPNLLDNATGI